MVRLLAQARNFSILEIVQTGPEASQMSQPIWLLNTEAKVFFRIFQFLWLKHLNSCVYISLKYRERSLFFKPGSVNELSLFLSPSPSSVCFFIYICLPLSPLSLSHSRIQHTSILQQKMDGKGAHLQSLSAPIPTLFCF
jgi:hypothetical protein